MNPDEAQTDSKTLMGFTLHQPWFDDAVMEEIEPLSDEEAVDPFHPEEEESSSSDSFVPTEAEKDAGLPRPVLQRHNAVAAFKTPARMVPQGKAPLHSKRDRSPPVAVEDDDVLPNLAEIFDNYDVPTKQRITICRSYASFLASMVPKKKAKK